MFKHLKKVKPILFILTLFITLVLSVRLFSQIRTPWFIDLLIVVLNIVLVLFILDYFESQKEQRSISVSNILGESVYNALLTSEVGIVVVNDVFEIVWISELLHQRNYHVINQKLLLWLPELKGLVNGEEESVTIHINDNSYLVTRANQVNAYVFKDITVELKLKASLTNQQVVFGLIHFDNYEESTQFEDEQRVTLIDSKIRQSVYLWADQMGIIVKRLRNNRMYLVLNESILQKAIVDNFSILENIRKASESLEVSITLSIAFSRGSDDFEVLEEMVNTALDLAQSRGGDQVAIKTLDEDIVYLGGSSEALEKKSKVRARVMAQSLRELILKSSNVVIMGHTDVDFDALGSAMLMSRFAYAYQKPVAIVLNTKLETKLKRAFKEYESELSMLHNFVNESQARLLIQEETLLILVDHHLEEYSLAPKLIKDIDRIVIIDHHRRNQDFSFDPILVYSETSASSTCEMLGEMISYHQHTVPITELEATFAYTGLVVDTQRFRNRTGSRTFEVASQFKKYGADTVLSDRFLKDSLEDMQAKTMILRNQKILDRGIILAFADESFVTQRSLISQVADQLLLVEGIEASFVLAKISDQTVGISARSNGNINVHAIMEKMNGNGHFTAAALQKEGTDVTSMLIELEHHLKETLEIEDSL
jgi:c-di-AMP phosphodiesterase-like protein